MPMRKKKALIWGAEKKVLLCRESLLNKSKVILNLKSWLVIRPTNFVLKV